MTEVLFLGNRSSSLINWLRLNGYRTSVIETDVNGMDLDYDWIISYNYRHIIKPDIVKKFRGRIINLHISYLPFNRGADPNFWSWVEDTKKGVTIHQIDKGIDTGDILCQKEVKIDMSHTLETSYELLHIEIQNLFKENWSRIVNNEITPIKQGDGTFHTKKDIEAKKHLLKDGWHTKIIDLYDRKFWDNLK